MDGDFLGKVKALLSDPESLERITAIAKGMSSPQAAPGADVRTGAAGQSRLLRLPRLRPSRRRCPRLHGRRAATRG